jgi:hypothetical protein
MGMAIPPPWTRGSACGRGHGIDAVFDGRAASSTGVVAALSPIASDRSRCK